LASATAAYCSMLCVVCCAGAASESSSDSDSGADVVASDEDGFVDSAKQQQQRKPLPGSAAAAAAGTSSAATSSAGAAAAGTAVGHGPPTEAEQQSVLEWLRKKITRSGGSLGDGWKVQLSGRRPTGGFKSRKFIAPDGTVCYTAPQVKRHLGLEQPGELLVAQLVYCLLRHWMVPMCVLMACQSGSVGQQLSGRRGLKGSFKSRKFIAPDGTVWYTAPQVKRYLGLEQPGELSESVLLRAYALVGVLVFARACFVSQCMTAAELVVVVGAICSNISTYILLLKCVSHGC
jgi:hypothetical protein